MDNQEITFAPPPESLRPLELPPAESVPLIKEYGRLGIDRFMDRYAIETQTDDRGFVDYGWLLGYVHSLVPSKHAWTGRLDVHHLQWTAEAYRSAHFDNTEDSSIPERFREMPFHKLLIPRDLHDLIHIVTLPPKLPDYDEMQKRVAAYDTAVGLFHAAKQAIDVESKERRLIPAPHPKYQDKTFDPVSKKLIERDVLIDQYWKFYAQFKGRLSETAQQDVEDLLNIDHLRARDPVFAVVSSLDKAVRLNKQKQAIRPKVRWEPGGVRRSA